MAIRLWALVVVAYTLGVGWFGYSLPIPEWIRSLGLVGMGLSALFSAWVYHELGIHFSPGIRLLENHDLVTSGPYRWVRHPMYTTFIAHACSTSLACANPFVIIASIIAIAGLVNRIDEEEEILQNRFGEQYLAYMDTTGRLIPKM